MESAYLRIRFTPLLQNFCGDNSKCCLEVIPEVSYLQNFENIHWKQGNDSIEYTIPVSYKVMLKRKEVVEQSNHDLENKTYHSCVDLLMPSSLTNMDLGFGDIMKIVSDTIVLNKIPTEDENNKAILSKKSSSIKAKAVKTPESIKVKTPESIKVKKNNMQIVRSLVGLRKANYIYKTVDTNTEKDFKDESSQVIKVISNNTSDDDTRISSIDTNFEYLPHNCISSTDIIMATKDQLSLNGSKAETKHELRVAPICSINTEDNYTIRKMTSKCLVFRVKDPKIFKVAFGDKVIESGSNIHAKCPTDIINDQSFQTLPRKAIERILPQVRIAQLVQTMNQEILPLKIMLNDIIHKCSILGLSWNKREHQNYKLYNSVSNWRTEKMKSNQKEYKCNRVVYSMMFD